MDYYMYFNVDNISKRTGVMALILYGYGHSYPDITQNVQKLYKFLKAALWLQGCWILLSIK